MEFDLTAAVKGLRRTKEGKRIASLIEGVSGLWSVARDLERVQGLLDLHRNLEGGPRVAEQDAADALVGQSLQVNAVLHYCRATHSSSKVRSTIQLQPKLSAEDWRKHRAICALRDDAIAHHGAGPDAEKTWIEEKLVLRIEDDIFTLSSVFKRANYRAWVAVTLNELLPQVQLIVATALNKKRTLLLDAIKGVSDADGAAITSEKFKSETFFEGPESTDAVPLGWRKTTWKPRGQ